MENIESIESLDSIEEKISEFRYDYATCMPILRAALSLGDEAIREKVAPVVAKFEEFKEEMDDMERELVEIRATLTTIH